MWIFGYGSLVWKADFPYVKKVVGYVKGYERKFYQASIDHRGVPEKPGRVVTLIPSDDPDAKVWGVAYELVDADSIKTMEALNSREKRYDRIEILFYPVHIVQTKGDVKSGSPKSSEEVATGSAKNVCGSQEPNEAVCSCTTSGKGDIASIAPPTSVTVYIGDTRGPLFLGYASTYDIALQIVEATGPSGPNRDYLFHLSYFMKSQLPNVTDTHLFDIERETRVWGVVYKIHKRDVEFVIRHLDIREMMGYEKLPTEFHPMPNHPLNIFELESNSIPISSAIKSSSSPVYLESSSPSPPASKTEEPENDSDSGRGSFISDEETRSNRGDDGSDTDNESISSDEDDFDVGYESVRDGQPFMVTMYFGAQDNEHYIGPSTLSTMALQIYECSGLSGSNREYLFKLAEAMREICPEALDEHLLQLERAVKSLERSHVCDGEQDGCVLRAL